LAASLFQRLHHGYAARIAVLRTPGRGPGEDRALGFWKRFEVEPAVELLFDYPIARLRLIERQAAGAEFHVTHGQRVLVARGGDAAAAAVQQFGSGVARL